MNTTTSHSRRRTTAAAFVSLGLVFGGVAAAAPAVAGPREVDPTTLTPAPPDYFNAECRAAGLQIICDLAFLDPFSPVEEPTGILCDSADGAFEVLDTWTRRVEGTRYYTADGLLERRHFRDWWEGTLTNSVTGATVTYVQRNTYLHDLDVLGDVGTGDEQQTTHLRLATSSGAVMLESGRIVVSLEEESTVFRAGIHRLVDYFENGEVDAVAPICDALS